MVPLYYLLSFSADKRNTGQLGSSAWCQYLMREKGRGENESRTEKAEICELNGRVKATWREPLKMMMAGFGERATGGFSRVNNTLNIELLINRSTSRCQQLTLVTGPIHSPRARLHRH